MAKAVFGIAKSESQAIAIADQLRAAAFPENDISVILPDKQGTKDFAHEQHTRDSRRRDGRRNCRRAVLGGALGWMGIGTLAIPDLSPLSWPI